MERKSEMMKQFIKWEKEYDWGRIVIGSDVSGFLILCGVNLGDDKRIWIPELCKSRELKKAILLAEKLTEEIEQDPTAYVKSKQTVPIALLPRPFFAHCKCCVEVDNG